MCQKKVNKVAALILAAGLGSRMNSAVTKQRILLCGKSILKRSVEAHVCCRFIDTVTVVCRDEEYDFVSSELSGITEKPISVVKGGNTRLESARLGFESLTSDVDYVSIHDAARCLITPEKIEAVIAAAISYGAASAGVRVTDTVKMTDAEMRITSTVPRDRLWAAATPQVFSAELYRRALSSLSGDESLVTDDNMLVENIGVMPVCVDTGKENIKITTPEDLAYAEFLINRRNGEK